MAANQPQTPLFAQSATFIAGDQVAVKGPWGNGGVVDYVERGRVWVRFGKQVEEVSPWELELVRPGRWHLARRTR